MTVAFGGDDVQKLTDPTVELRLTSALSEDGWLSIKEALLAARRGDYEAVVDALHDMGENDADAAIDVLTNVMAAVGAVKSGYYFARMNEMRKDVRGLRIKSRRAADQRGWVRRRPSRGTGSEGTHGPELR